MCHRSSQVTQEGENAVLWDKAVHGVTQLHWVATVLGQPLVGDPCVFLPQADALLAAQTSASGRRMSNRRER